MTSFPDFTCPYCRGDGERHCPNPACTWAVCQSCRKMTDTRKQAA